MLKLAKGETRFLGVKVKSARIVKIRSQTPSTAFDMVYLYLRVVVGDRCGVCPLVMMILTHVELWQESHTW